MREKLIELLDETFDKQYDRNLVITARNTADHLIANGVTIQKWIPVSERLPREGEFFLAYASGIVGEAVRPLHERKLYWIGCEECSYEIEATHWMPLPEPPKEDQQ